MNHKLPQWALRPVGQADRATVQEHHESNTLEIAWPDTASLRHWAKAHGWPASRFFLRARFMKKLLESDDSFSFGITASGVRISVPVEQFTIPEKELGSLDRLYESRNERGHPDGLDVLVEELREVRRAVEAGVEIKVEGKTLKNFNQFYSWAHGRYHMLEDGADKWIGDDL